MNPAAFVIHVTTAFDVQTSQCRQRQGRVLQVWIIDRPAGSVRLTVT
jgi:hypothetical protein